MKRFLIFLALMACATIAFADASDPSNAFADFGNCEVPVFTIASTRGSWQTMEDAQWTTATGVEGDALLVNATTGRFEGSSAAADTSWVTGTDAVLQFYYKMPTSAYSYPRLALRQDPVSPITNGEVGDCGAFIEWQNTSFTIDTNWNLFEPDITTLDWDAVDVGDFYTNNYAVPEFYLDEIWLTDPTPADASDDPNNAFASFGNCEVPVFTEPSARTDWPTLEDAQWTTATGVIGDALYVNADTGRFEGSSVDVAVDFSGTDVVCEFYYKILTTAYSYPRLAVRQDPNVPETNGEVQDCAAYVEWTNTAWTADTSWHLFQGDITALNWDGVSTADFYTNNYAVPEWYLDEIYLYDPTPPSTAVTDWGLY